MRKQRGLPARPRGTPATRPRADDRCIRRSRVLAGLIVVLVGYVAFAQLSGRVLPGAGPVCAAIGTALLIHSYYLRYRVESCDPATMKTPAQRVYRTLVLIGGLLCLYTATL